MMAGGRIDVRAGRLDAQRIEREILRRAHTLLGRGARAGDCWLAGARPRTAGKGEGRAGMNHADAGGFGCRASWI